MGREGKVWATKIHTGEVWVLRKECGEGRVKGGKVCGQRGPEKEDVRDELGKGIGDKAGFREGGLTEGGGDKVGRLNNGGS